MTVYNLSSGQVTTLNKPDYAYHKPNGNPCKTCGLSPDKHYTPEYVYHKPIGNPCTKCGLSPDKHRVFSYHTPDGDPCKRCGEPASIHRIDNYKYHKSVGDPCEKCGKPASKHIFKPAHKPEGDPCIKCGLSASKHVVEKRAFHKPIGDPCEECGKPASKHKKVVDTRVFHKPVGDPCEKCGKPASKHKVSTKVDTRVYHKPVGDPCEKCGKPASKHRVNEYHKPIGDPCKKCGKPASKHRVESRSLHKPVGDPCEKCGKPASRHKLDSRVYHKCQGDPCETCGLSPDKHRHIEPVYIGIDGEGQGRDIHKYTFLAAATEDGKRRWSVENKNGLSSLDCLSFFMMLPADAKLFTYFFSYDLTKILEDLPNELIYLLWRPGLRARGPDAPLYAGPKPIKWNGFHINMRASKLSIFHPKTGKRLIIWDIGKFYQSKFVESLKLWKVGDETSLDSMAEMKEQRSNFDKLSFDGIKAYCFSECMHLATLARKLCDAHDEAGLKLKSFYGAGSSASAMLQKMGIKDYIEKTPDGMLEAAASAFFGGRFENSVLGEINQTVYGKDISSAYPYQTYFLPCLKHGKWEKTRSRRKFEASSNALVRYVLKAPGLSDDKSWGPFPFRDENGSICYPIESGGGWIWKEEFLAGEKLFPNAQFIEAWVYHNECDCHPFKHIAHYYSERCRIGKSGPGIVLKLGCNSVYGKLAQSVGQGQFNSWIWAGLVTSGCRAQILELLGLHSERRNMLMVATDGIYSLEDIKCPTPKNTGTWETGKPLGGWESEKYERGVFVARPGIYFPLNPTEDDLKKIRGRGLGKKVVLENANKIHQEFLKYGIDHQVHIANMSRFCGGKTSISRSGKPGHYSYKRAYALPGLGERSYGQWITQPITVSFDPMPKRDGLSPDKRTLLTRRVEGTSVPYKKAVMSIDAMMLKAITQVMEEQPDGDWTDYG